MEDMRPGWTVLFFLRNIFIIFEGKYGVMIKKYLLKNSREGGGSTPAFDDFGSLIINIEFRHELCGYLVIFSPIHEGTSRLTFNYRIPSKNCHYWRKYVGYTGGINIGDGTLILRTLPDIGRIQQCALRDGHGALTCIFLEMWGFSKGYEDLDYTKYKPQYGVEAGGICPAHGGRPCQ